MAAEQLRRRGRLGGPLAVEVKSQDVWPDKIFNVKAFGTKGDSLADDTKAIRAALDAAKQNGGGIVSLPWGTYRLKDYLVIPERTVLRGAGRDCRVLQWPVDEPKTRADFSPVAAYGVARYAVEDLTKIVRKADTLFMDLSDNRVPKELSALKPAVSRDVFFRGVNFQHWLMCGHPDPRGGVVEHDDRCNWEESAEQVRRRRREHSARRRDGKL